MVPTSPFRLCVVQVVVVFVCGEDGKTGTRETGEAKSIELLFGRLL